ncbi:MAG: hypothetical protein ACI4OB_06810 [Christensenellales bacterium]
MKLNTCPDCGANLDPGERCDCHEENEKEQPHANENCPKGKKPYDIIAHIKVNCNNPLQYIRTVKQIPAKEVVEFVRGLHPKYDKTLQSKCERLEDYGVELETEAMIAVVEAYAPELLIEKPTAVRQAENRRLKCRISCRLEDELYAKLLLTLKAKGFMTVQDWLHEMISIYLSD